MQLIECFVFLEKFSEHWPTWLANGWTGCFTFSSNFRRLCMICGTLKSTYNCIGRCKIATYDLKCIRQKCIISEWKISIVPNKNDAHTECNEIGAWLNCNWSFATKICATLQNLICSIIEHTKLFRFAIVSVALERKRKYRLLLGAANSANYVLVNGTVTATFMWQYSRIT